MEQEIVAQSISTAMWYFQLVFYFSVLIQQCIIKLFFLLIGDFKRFVSFLLA